jgi:phosphoglycerate dehydrogenase-like enzyme
MADFSIGIVGLDTLGSALIRRLNAQGIGTTGTDINSRLV